MILVSRSQKDLLSSKHGVAASENLSPPHNFRQGVLWHFLSDLDFTRSSSPPLQRRVAARPCAHLQTNGRMGLCHLL
jgi:hypothetical protein